MTGVDHSYALEAPTVDDLRRTVLRLCGDNAEALWRDLLRHAGVDGADLDRAAFERLLRAMHGSEPALRLAAQAQAVRRRTWEEMSNVHVPAEEQTA